ncbi:MAG: pyridoxamine 5'-phosphate oxidase family protein, partial [Syntrophomonas sp.]|nr:pyridoxamine 5'-phosphate oxidase family protein [Syntrophomonas sp.]
MDKYTGDRLPPVLYQFFAEDTMVGVAATVDADGFPRGAPMSQFYAPGERVMLMAVQNRSRTWQNAVRTGKLALTFMGANNLVFTIQGYIRVFRENMRTNPYLGILVVDITKVNGNQACDVVVTGGISTQFINQEWRRRLETWLAELRSYTLEDV